MPRKAAPDGDGQAEDRRRLPPWIPIRESLPDDPRVGAMAAELGVTHCDIVGRLVIFWSWAGQITDSGLLMFATHKQIDDVAGLPGFASALESVRWLRTRGARIYVPEWNHWNSRCAKARLRKSWHKKHLNGVQNGPNRGTKGAIKSPKRGPTGQDSVRDSADTERLPSVSVPLPENSTPGASADAGFSSDALSADAGTAEAIGTATAILKRVLRRAGVKGNARELSDAEFVSALLVGAGSDLSFAGYVAALANNGQSVRIRRTVARVVVAFEQSRANGTEPRNAGACLRTRLRAEGVPV